MRIGKNQVVVCNIFRCILEVIVVVTYGMGLHRHHGGMATIVVRTGRGIVGDRGTITTVIGSGCGRLTRGQIGTIAVDVPGTIETEGLDAAVNLAVDLLVTMAVREIMIVMFQVEGDGKQIEDEKGVIFHPHPLRPPETYLAPCHLARWRAQAAARNMLLLAIDEAKLHRRTLQSSEQNLERAIRSGDAPSTSGLVEKDMPYHQNWWDHVSWFS